jgi:hypothetical protein
MQLTCTGTSFNEADDMPDTQRVDLFELRFSRLTRRSDPIVEATPVIDGFPVGHEIPLLPPETGPGG